MNTETNNLIETKLWYVTKPTLLSELGDVLFGATLARLELQFAGGLKAANVVGVFANYESARVLAVDLLDSRDEAEMAAAVAEFDAAERMTRRVRRMTRVEVAR